MSWVFNPFTGNLDYDTAGATTTPEATQLTIRNETGVSIATTRAVYVTGFNNHPLIALADNTDETKHNVIGVTIGAIAHEADGTIATGGEFSAETNSWNVGDELYLSTSGQLTTTEPTSGAVMHIGIVTVKQNYPVGKILLYTQPEGNTVAVGSSQDVIVRMGDNAAANKVSFRDYANNEVAYINSDGVISVAQGPVIGGFTLTVPATGTAALLATQNVFTVQQMVDGTADQIQLRVQAHSTQTNDIVTFENYTGGTIYSRITKDGWYQIGGTDTTARFYATGTISTAGSFASFAMVSTAAVAGSVAGLSFTGYSRNTSGTMAQVSALLSITQHDRAGTVTNLEDINLRCTMSLGTVTNKYGIRGEILTVSGATVGTIKYISIPTPTVSSGSLTNAYALYINSYNTAATLNYAIYTNAGLNRFGDQIEVVGSQDLNQLKVTGFTTQTLPVGYLIDNTSATNTVRNVLQLETQSTGTAAAGLGAGLLYSLETATGGTMQNAGQISAVWTDATNATRKAKLQLSAYDTAQRIGIEVEASGSAPMLGFFGATPVVKPSAYTPTNVSADRSYDANATTVDELADVLGTLISDLQGLGLIG